MEIQKRILYNSCEYEYILIRMKRKTLSLSIDNELRIVLKAPYFVTMHDIEAFFISHIPWVESAKQRALRRKESVFTDDPKKLAVLYDRGKTVLVSRIKYFSELTGLVPANVRITKAKTRLGSCSGANNLCFSVFLFAYPDEVVDYVILHELCHIKHKNHSSDFYSEIQKYMPDYKSRIAVLKNHFN